MIAKRMPLLFLALGLAALMLVFGIRSATAQVTGAIFTTDATCTGVDLNHYATKDDVYIDGGPAKIGATGLPEGGYYVAGTGYYVQVTEPNGKVLGRSKDPAVVVDNFGELVGCYRLSDIVYSYLSGYQTPGYDDTSNSGGEYKVWISKDPNFANKASKTDNFKVKDSDLDGIADGDDSCPSDPTNSCGDEPGAEVS
jgi:hypothetical protein